MRFGNDALSFMQYYSLISAILRDWHTQIQNNDYILVQLVQSLFDKLVKGDYCTKLIYLDLNTSKKELSKMNEKWNCKLKTNVEYNDFVKIVRCIPEISQEVHLQSFQYCFLMHAIFLNDKLFLWKVVDKPWCNFCLTNTQTLEHLFFMCPKVNNIWQSLQNWYEAMTDTEVNITYEIYCVQL